MKMVLNTQSARILSVTIVLLAAIGIVIAVTGTTPNPGHDFDNIRGDRLYTSPDSGGEFFWITAPRGPGENYLDPDDLILGIKQTNGETDQRTVAIGNEFNLASGQETLLDVYGDILARTGIRNPTPASDDPDAEGFVYVNDDLGLRVQNNLEVQGRTYFAGRTDVGTWVPSGFFDGGQLFNIAGGISLQAESTDPNAATEGGQLILIPGTSYTSGNTYWVLDNYYGNVRFYSAAGDGSGDLIRDPSAPTPFIIHTVMPGNETRMGINFPPAPFPQVPDSTLDVRGVVRATQFIPTSDARLKTGIEEIEMALEKILELRGVYFNWTEEANGSDGRQVGILAQEIEETISEVVITSEDGIKSVNYDGLVGMLVEAIKEQQEIIDSQQEQIENLEKRILALEKQ